MIRVLLIFSKTDKARFIGHLDLLRVFRRAINRAKLPAAYSGGFNPHQKLRFAVPLALGMAGFNEAAELELDEPVTTDALAIKDTLNTALPKGVMVHKARFMDKDEKSISILVTAACYEMHTAPEGVLPERAREIGARKSVIVPKKTKRGIYDVDIRPDILSLEASGDILRAVISAGSRRGLKPDLLAGAMGVSFNRQTRLNVYKDINGELLPLFDKGVK